jgi:hypothetical protein
MKLIRGVGIKDVKVASDCPFYIKWKNMIDRSYGPKTGRNKTYTECSVCEEWLIFSNFKAWMEAQDWKGKDLDKDWLVRGSTTYSPETCMFVTPEHNKLLTGSESTRGIYPIGVSYRQKAPSMVNELKRPYRACICIDGEFVSLGSFSTPEAAHALWQITKMQVLKREFEKEGLDTRLKGAMMTRYELLLNDLASERETEFL